MNKKVLMTASVASMIDLFNMDNIEILIRMGYEVHVACNFEFGSITSKQRVEEFRQELETAGIKTYHIPIPRNISDMKNIIESYRKLRKLCEEQHYAIVHAQSPIGGVVTRQASKKQRSFGTRVVYTAHGFHFYHGAPIRNWLLFYPIEKYYAKYTDDLITINQEDYVAAQKLKAKHVHYVPGIGVDIDKFANVMVDSKKMRAELNLQEKDFVVLSVGQLSKRKNHGIIIEAMSQIKNLDIKYVIVGLGELEENYRKKIESLNLQGKVILAGYRRDIRELLHIADCFVFPSLQEGLPASLMEAMAAGVPVVCSAIRGNVDLIEDGIEGRLLKINDMKGYADAIESLWRNPELLEKYRESAERKILGFSRKQVMKCMELIYASAVNIDI